jgi:hypothetical protein
MQPGAVINLTHRRRRRIGTLAATACLLAAACASGRPEPARLGGDQVAKCRQLEQAYRAAAPEYATLRDQVVADPVAAAWVTKMFVRDVFTAREGRPVDQDRWRWLATSQKADPLEARAIAELVHLGAIAVPTLVEDLLYHDQPLPRELGVELLARIGAPAVQPLQKIARDGEPRQRRAAARALGGIGATGDVLATLRDLAADGDYTVRADALRAMEGGGDEARAVVLAALREDQDPFVRRVAAETLAAFPRRSTALALVDYLERCKREDDRRGEEAAQTSLQRVEHAASGAVRDVKAPHPLAPKRTPQSWRTFAQSLDEPLPVGSARAR